MKKLLILSVFCISLTNVYGQTNMISDSSKIISFLDEFLNAIQLNNNEVIRKISTKNVYCILCIHGPISSESPYMLNIDMFLNNHLNSFRELGIFQRATEKKDLKIIQESENWSDLRAIITILEPNELARGHEGGQIGIYLKLVGTEYKFAGFETIP